MIRSNRREFLKTAGVAAGAFALGAPSIARADDKSIRVGTYGGYFEDSFKEHIYPDFTKETGIEVNSVAVSYRRDLADPDPQRRPRQAGPGRTFP